MITFRTGAFVLCLASLAPMAALAAPANVDQLKAEYAAASQELEKNLGIVETNAPSCGFMGGKIAGYMREAITNQQTQRKRVLDAVTSAQKNHSDAAPALQKEIADMNASNEKGKSNLSTVRYALSTNTPTCKLAASAFERMFSLSLGLPNRLNAMILALSGSSGHFRNNYFIDSDYDFYEGEAND